MYEIHQLRYFKHVQSILYLHRIVFLAKTTFGNGSFTVFNIGPKIIYSENGLLSTVAYKLGENSPAVYALEGLVQEAGSILDWLTNLGIPSDPGDMTSFSPDINYENDIILVPSSSGSLAPYWRYVTITIRTVLKLIITL